MAGGRAEETNSTLEAAIALEPSIRAAAAEIEQGRRVSPHAACAKAVEMLYKAYGGSSVYSSGPFDRSLRDILTINRHTINSLKIHEAAGQVLLGLDPQEPIL